MDAAGQNLSEKKTRKNRILVVDDERGARMALEVPLRMSGYNVSAVSNGEAAIEIIEKEFFDLVLTDVYMPGITGLEVVRRLGDLSPETKVIVMTGQGSLETAMQAIAEGAIDFLAKPFDIEDVLSLVQRTLTPPEKHLEIAEAEVDFSSSGIVGHSPQIVRVYKLIAFAARTRSTVLIEGETGTGKELVARAIHNHGARGDKPFVAVNCSALTDTLLESELFGYTKGAFTGAATDRAGLFESASGGTIFLDEIGTASHSLQAGLLRVLQEREIRRIGSNEPRKIDVRIIAASNKSLEELANDGEFRRDLFYRMSVLKILMPPLRERGREDFELLVRHFLKKYAGDVNSSMKISDEAVGILAGHAWQGNVRELENTIEYLIAVASGDLISASDLPPQIITDSSSNSRTQLKKPFSLADDRPTLEELNRRYAQIVLSENQGNKSRAAEILGINRRTLYRYLDLPESEIETNGEED